MPKGRLIHARHLAGAVREVLVYALLGEGGRRGSGFRITRTMLIFSLWVRNGLRHLRHQFAEASLSDALGLGRAGVSWRCGCRLLHPTKFQVMIAAMRARKPISEKKSAQLVAARAAGRESGKLGGRPSGFKLEFAHVARLMCKNGATDAELADALGLASRSRPSADGRQSTLDLLRRSGLARASMMIVSSGRSHNGRLATAMMRLRFFCRRDRMSLSMFPIVSTSRPIRLRRLSG
jgi:hypothetical protein